MKNKDRGIARYFPALQHFNLPNVITTMGFACGIFASYFLTQRNLRMALIVLFFAGVADLLDGFVASKLNQQTSFGRYLDTLVDFFTCGIIPIWMVFDLLVYDRILSPGYAANNIFIVAGLIFYCVCALWRLSYYNVIEAKHFTGLPVPGSMMLVSMAIWCVHMYGWPLWIAAATFFIIGALMLSGITLKKYGLWQILMGVAGLGFVVMVLIP